MSKRMFDIIMIVIITLFLMTLSFFDLLENSSKFMLIPIIIFYYLGQYSERKFKK